MRITRPAPRRPIPRQPGLHDGPSIACIPGRHPLCPAAYLPDAETATLPKNMLLMIVLPAKAFGARCLINPDSTDHIPVRTALSIEDSAASPHIMPSPERFAHSESHLPLAPANVSSVPLLSPFRYPGGKTWFVPYIRAWLAAKAVRPALFVEPFAGGAIAGLTAAVERLTDDVLLVEKDEEVAAVWHAILGGHAPELARLITDFEMTPDGVDTILAEQGDTPAKRAFHTILRNRINRGGILASQAGRLKNGETLKRQNGHSRSKGLSSRWYPNTLVSRIELLASVRDRIQFEEGDGLSVLRKFSDREEIAWFLDPPYSYAGKRAGSRLYRYFDLDHAALFGLVQRLKGDFLMTYDRTDEIMELASRYQLDVHTIRTVKTAHHKQVPEVVIGRDLTWMRCRLLEA